MTSAFDGIRLIAMNTVRELLRNKLLYNLLLFAVLLIASSLFVAQLTIGQWDRIILDMGLAAAEIAGVLVAVVIGVGLVAGEIERKTIFPTLAKPLARGAFVCGRYVGLAFMLAVNVAVMTCSLAVVLRVAGYGISQTAAAAALLIFVELLVVSAGAIFFASFTTPILASAFALSLFLIGHLVSSLRLFAERTKSGLARTLTLAAYRVLPDLELFNLKSQAANELPVPHGATITAALYGAAFAAAFLLLAIAVFSRRDLK
jgi:ABC-type transport system involved in multi-copper enzyme maturation permease subunit